MIIVVPKNRGLAERAEKALTSAGISAGAKRCRVRGEDVPAIASMLAAQGDAVLAFTGEDLLAEWLAGGSVLDGRLRRRTVEWFDRKAIFGKPSLCLVTPPDAPLSQNRRRVAICARYAKLAEPELQRIERDLGISLERSYHHGALEILLEHGLADAIVDIVVTGSTIRERGLRIVDLFFRSDLAVLETA